MLWVSSLLNPPFDFPDVVQVLFETLSVGRSEVPLERRHLPDHPVQDTAVCAATSGALLGRTASAEQLIERDAGIANHWQWLRGRRPTDGVRVHAGVAIGATTGLVHVLDAELHRGDRRILSKSLRIHLIQGRAHQHV